MLIVNIIGGLGNQMFQYAYSFALSKRGYSVKLSTADYSGYKLHNGFVLDSYKISLTVASEKEINRLKPSKLARKLSFFPFSGSIKEKSLRFNCKYLNPKDNCYIDGYFQCEDYFKEYRAELLNEFKQSVLLSAYTQAMAKKIKSDRNAISLHIRRGDYVKDSKTNRIHGTCELEYYVKALEYFDNKYEDRRYYVFSDDIEWVKLSFHRDNFIYIDTNEKRSPHEDMHLMSLCFHNIIANSSFSWWGAWLNDNSDKVVIAPKQWFKDKSKQFESTTLVPEEWVRI